MAERKVETRLFCKMYWISLFLKSYLLNIRTQAAFVKEDPQQCVTYSGLLSSISYWLPLDARGREMSTKTWDTSSENKGREKNRKMGCFRPYTDIVTSGIKGWKLESEV